MKRGAAKTSLIILSVLALMVGILTGCSANGSNANEEQQANRAYMSQVNEIMAELDENLDSFTDAVSRGDIVNMRTQADNAYKSLDKLSSLEATEDLADVQQCYVEGTEKLREALDEYIKLYSEIESGSFDQSTYDARIAKVQSLYDEGVSSLEEGDKTAAEKE